MITSAPDRAAGPSPALAAVRARLGLVALLFVARRDRLVVDGGADARHGRRSLDRARHARLVPRRVGRDDGRDDVPVARADGRAVLADDEDRIQPLLFTAGYLVTWGAAGALAFAVAQAGEDVLAWEHAGRWVAGATLLGAAVYELTPLKDVCLAKCRSPLGFLLGAWRDGHAGALRMGVKHGGWCVGCCWALMASLFALGVMSIAWMAFVAALIAAEKTLPWRRVATYGTAVDPAGPRRVAARRARSNPGPHGPDVRRDAGHAGNGVSERGSPRAPGPQPESTGSLSSDSALSSRLSCSQLLCSTRVLRVLGASPHATASGGKVGVECS